MRKKIEAFLRRQGELVDIRDVHCYGGMACVAYGLWQVYQPAAWCVVGAVLFWLSVKR